MEWITWVPPRSGNCPRSGAYPQDHRKVCFPGQEPMGLKYPWSTGRGAYSPQRVVHIDVGPTVRHKICAVRCRVQCVKAVETDRQGKRGSGDFQRARGERY